MIRCVRDGYTHKGIIINMNTKVPWLATGFVHDMSRTPHNYKINNLENMIDPG